jgi:hypothetical protein
MDDGHCGLPADEMVRWNVEPIRSRRVQNELRKKARAEKERKKTGGLVGG